jgi:beta-1,4-mannosyl-glycoprotein beta-1,4-N-acetylglucosaminyltransferase
MEILDKYVDYFVIGECNKTFQGKDKPFYYLENKDRYKKFSHKIVHSLFIDNMSISWNVWDRDKNHKNAIAKALTKCVDNDIILLSDADEIINPNVLKQILINGFKNDELIVLSEEDYCSYFIDARIDKPWPGTRICKWKLYQNNSFDELRNMGSLFWKNNLQNIIQLKRKDFSESLGWHYTNLGSVENIIYKIESWGHKEYNNDYIKNNLKNNIENLNDFIFRPGFNANKYVLDKSNCPEYILNNLKNFDNFLCNNLNKGR